MVKRWIFIILLTIALVVSCILETNFINQTFDDLIAKLYMGQAMINQSGDNINTIENIEYMDNLHDEFHKAERGLKSIIWHTGLKDVEVSVSRVITYIKENDKTEALTELNALIDYCEHYKLDFSVTIENIL